MIELWIAILAIVVVAIVSYIIGWHTCNNQWKDGVADRVNELMAIKINEVSGLYDEAYRNVLKNFVRILTEMEEEDDGQE